MFACMTSRSDVLARPCKRVAAAGWSGGWPLASDLNNGVKDVLFASGATVKIDISGRADMKALAKSASPYLLTWSTAPSNVTFAMADGSTYVDGVRLRYDETGLKVETMRGLVIIFN